MQSIEVSDKFWNIVKWHLPKRSKIVGKKYINKVGSGRKRDFKTQRRYFCGILFILKTGSQWAFLPKEYGAKSTVHNYFTMLCQKGFFESLWKRGLHEYDEFEGIA